jgi:PRTRC genetic system ThiF family protein
MEVMMSYLSYLKQLQLYGYQKLGAWLGPLLRQALATAQPQLDRLAQKIKVTKQYRLEIGHPDRVVILLVGTGGTGSFVAHILAQLASWAATAGLDMRLYFVDPDTVEEKNLVRQNFCRAELGAPKAFSLAWRYTAAFGVTITPVVERFSAAMLDRYQPKHTTNGSLMIVVGAVDNVCARRDIAQAITDRLQKWPWSGGRDRLIWLDAGNERVNGQVLLGNSLETEPLLSPLGFCTDLPLPHLQEPDLLADRERPLRQAQDGAPLEADLSCADLTALAEQSAMINRLMATWVGIYLYRLLQSRDLTMMATFVNLRSGLTRSTPIAGGRVVFPKRRELPAAPGAETAEPEPGQGCPVCGGEVISGQDEWHGILIHVNFCAACNWREEGCPHCQGEIVEEEIELESGDIVPGLYCATCDWYQPIPAAQPTE